MATSADYRPAAAAAARSGPSISTQRSAVHSPRSPHTPMLGRSVSSQFGSPGAFRPEQEDIVTYELNQRYLSAGFAAESRPRCILPFTPDAGRRLGDYRPHDAEYVRKSRAWRTKEAWGAGYELYTNDVRELDVGLVEDKLERCVRAAHVDHLQLDARPRRCLLVLPSMLPTPLIELALKVLFSHFTQPPSVSLLSSAIMCCVSAGLRTALVVDIGWEETVVTAVGEYKETGQKRTTRAGKQLTREMAHIIEGSVPREDEVKVTFDEADDITQRMAWCQSRTPPPNEEAALVRLPVPGGEPTDKFDLLFDKLAEPAEKVLFASGSTSVDHDDNELPIHLLAHRLLLAIPIDVRSLCVSRIVVTGTYSHIPGLKRRLLQEITHVISTRGWDPVSSYGKAKALKERSPNTANLSVTSKDARSPSISLSPLKMPLQDAIAANDRVHDDIRDPISMKTEREQAKGRVEPVKGIVRGVETLGPWAGASLMASLRVKGVHEVEREDFLKFGLKDAGDAI